MRKIIVLLSILSIIFFIGCTDKIDPPDNSLLTTELEDEGPDNTLPQISISSPADAETFGMGNIIVTGTASDNDIISTIGLSFWICRNLTLENIQ